MSRFECPLCHQAVSQSLYEKITGIWKEKEKKLEELKQKEQNLVKKEKLLKEKIEKEKKTMSAKFTARLNTERTKLQREILQIQNKFKNRLAREVNSALKIQKNDFKSREIYWKEQLKISGRNAVEAAQKKLSQQKEKIEKRERNLKNKNIRLLDQYRSLQSKYTVNLENSSKKIKSLEEQLTKNQTPQMLGLLEEAVFLKKLAECFPEDRFMHTGKGGDILQYVTYKKKEIGSIVYELKKVANFSKDHITQTLQAKEKREADYGILVTNAKRSKDDAGFSVSKSVIIIHPAAVMVLVTILREHLMTVSRLKLSGEQRKQTVQAVLEYIQSPNFKNSIDNIIQDTLDLYEDLRKEVERHTKTWDFRLNKYRGIYAKTNQIQSKVIYLIGNDENKKKLLPAKMTDISLPIGIK